jgi:competence/damage-inducible protein CinA-like protein
MTTAEIITIGTELLLGETVDTNTRHIARTLRDLGINLFRTQTIGDNANRIASLMREALERVDFVITTGGLGPTVDDPTREAAALAAGLFLEYRPELWEQVKSRISHYGRTPTENQKRQAYLPQFAIAIENPVGTAPSFIIEFGQKSIICLPGVPREMETLLKNSVVPYLQEHYNLNEVIQIRTLHVSGLGEGVIDERIGDLEILINPTVGLTAHSGIVSIRIAAKAGTTIETSSMIAKTEKELRNRLGDDIFGADEETLEAIALQGLDKRGWTLACVEFQTEDSLNTRLARTSHPAFRGGISLSVWDKSIMAVLEKTLSKLNASAGLGVACSFEEGEQTAALILITPHGQEERLLKYGGHPGNLPRWAVNMALDWLRRTVLREADNAK